MDKVQRIIDKLPPWILTVVTVVVILWLTLAPMPLGDIEPELFPGADKVVHAIMFGWLAFVAYIDRSRLKKWRKIPSAYVITIAAIVIAFGISIEFIQDAMGAGRSFDLNDILADAAGVILTALLWFLFTRFHHGRKHDSRKGADKQS